MAFYKVMVQRHVEEGRIDEEDLTENFKVESSAWWMAKRWTLYLELFIMLACSPPIHIDGTMVSQMVVTIPSINWQDNVNTPQSLVYDTPYFVSDFFLMGMFARFYFIVMALIMHSPVNERLYGKRVCQNAGFSPKFAF